MNFPMLRQVIDYASEQAARKGVKIDFSLTTNATLLTPVIIDYLAANKVGVTVSLDGPKEMNDAFRVFSNGRGSYDIIEPKVRELLARHHTRPIAPPLPTTSQPIDRSHFYTP